MPVFRLLDVFILFLGIPLSLDYKGGKVGNYLSCTESFLISLKISANKFKQEKVVSLCYIVKNSLSSDMVKC